MRSNETKNGYPKCIHPFNYLPNIQQQKEREKIPQAI